MQAKLIGRVSATEKFPTTMDSFTFWTDSDFRLNAFDIVKVEHLDGSFTFGSVKNVSHITDAQSFLTGYISSGFGDLEMKSPTLRVGMNYAEVQVSYNTKNIYTPVHNDAPVYLASPDEIIRALGLGNVQNPIICGSLTIYEGTRDEITLPVKMNAKFLLGPEGAHLNISGISGLAAKTSYAMFLMKAIQERYINLNDENDSIAFVIFNVKGRDLTAIDSPNRALTEQEREKYQALGLSSKPFRNVRYYIPFSQTGRNTYIPSKEVDDYIFADKLLKFKYCYEDDRESLEMLFADVDDPLQTIESIISKIIDENDSDFGNEQIKTWAQLIEKVNTLSQRKSGASNEITVQSWRKFKRLLGKSVKNEDMFAPRVAYDHHECRLADELKRIKPGDVKVIDIAKLSEDKQAFVFGDALRTIYRLKLGEYEGVNPPSKIIIFIDELNKYASKDAPKNSPLLHAILDVTERGRSLGIIMFGAEQFRSGINARASGNCAAHAYGRTNSIEVSGKDYSHFPETYKNILLRLEQGEYLLQSPVFRSLLKVKFPRPVYKQFND